MSESGSSPRMRGILLPSLSIRFGIWFIPADAGNTCLPAGHHLPIAVHPRGCGEYGSYWKKWGAVIRFIPADAGNTHDSTRS